MCIVDRIHHPTCNHTTYHLLMSCSRPKTPNLLSEFEFCAQPTYRPLISSTEFSCVVCIKTKATNMMVAGAPAGKENVKAGGPVVGGSKGTAVGEEMGFGTGEIR